MRPIDERGGPIGADAHLRRAPTRLLVLAQSAKDLMLNYRLSRRKGTVLSLLSVLAVLVPLAVASDGEGPAAADQISSLKSQADQMAAQITSDGSRIHSLDAQLGEAQSRLAVTDTQLSQTRGQIAGLQHQVSSSRATLEHQAVTAYVIGGSSGGWVLLDSRDANQLSLRKEYLAVAAGDTTQTIARLHQQNQILGIREIQLAQQQQVAQSAADALARSRQGAASAAQSEAATLSSLNGQLGVLVAQAEQAKLAAIRQTHAASRSPAQASAEGQPIAGGLQQRVVGPPPTGNLASQLAGLRQCESGGNYSTDTGNGYYGAYQFSASTWQGLGYSGLPSQAAPAVQDQAATALVQRSGWGPWPTCSAILGL